MKWIEWEWESMKTMGRYFHIPITFLRVARWPCGVRYYFHTLDAVQIHSSRLAASMCSPSEWTASSVWKIYVTRCFCQNCTELRVEFYVFRHQKHLAKESSALQDVFLKKDELSCHRTTLIVYFFAKQHELSFSDCHCSTVTVVVVAW